MKRPSPRRHDFKHGKRSPHAASGAPRHHGSVSTFEAILLGVLFLVPVVFSRWTEDAWDYPKGALVTAGALVLTGFGIAAELARLQNRPPGPWLTQTLSRVGSSIRNDLLGGALLLFVFSSFVSAILSPNPGLGVFGASGSYGGSLVAASYAVLYFAARSLGGGVKTFARMSATIGVAAAVASAYGVIQFVGRDPLEWGMVPYLRGLRRVAGTMGQPNLLGALLIMSLPLNVWLIARGKSTASRVGWSAVALLSLAALAMTFSRAAWVALPISAFGGLLLFIWTRPLESPASQAMRTRLAFAVTAGAVVIVAIGGFVGSRTPLGNRLITRVKEIASLEESGTSARLQSWAIGIKMGMSRPILGVGTDQFGIDFPMYRTPSYYRVEHGAVAARAHNEAVNLFATQGFFGLLAGCLIVLFAAIALWRALRHRDPWLHAAVVVTGVSLAGFLMWDLVNYTVAGVGTLAAALAGWLSAASRSAEAASDQAATQSSRDGHRRGRKPAWSNLTAAVLVALAFIPLVLRPAQAQRAQRVARSTPVGGPQNLRALNRAATLAPWEARHHHHLASSYLTGSLAQKDTASRVALLGRARQSVEKAIEIDDRVALFHARRGWILAHLISLRAPRVRVSDMRESFATALERDPANLNILELNAEAWLLLHQHAEARAAALACTEVYPEALAKPFGYIGLIALREGRWADAADTLAQSTRADWRGDSKARALALANLSAAYIETRRYAEGLAAAEEAIAIDPDLPAATNNRDAARQLLQSGAPN